MFRPRGLFSASDDYVSAVVEKVFRSPDELKFVWGRSRTTVRRPRCRFESIEVKCAFRTRAFEASWLHHPKRPAGDSVVVVDSVGNELAPLDPFHSNLRERDIQEAHLLCYHFRVTSQRQCNNKLRGNKINAYQTLTADELRDWDYPERVDDTLSVKSKRRPKRFD
ncbi:MAG: hypothetical protein AAFX94_09170 [Myxococcota bacterium]